MNVEIYNYDKIFAATKGRVINAPTSEKNKELLFDFAEIVRLGSISQD